MKNRHLISGALAVLLLLTGCGGPQGNPMGLDEQENVTLMTTAAPATVPTAALPDEKICDFRVETEDGQPVSYDPAANSYTISSGGTYDCWGSLYEGRLLVDAEEDAKVTVNLNGCTITCSAAPPVEIVKADKVEISAKKDTQNRILDLREMPEGAEEDATGGAILSDCDLTIKGNGQLEVVSNYNNGIHTKDDLVIKNLTLLVSAVNNGLKGNDSVTIESGNLTVISTGGDGIKTTSSDLNNNGIQRGSVEILGGNVTVYAACDGIDSASDVTISGDGELNLYTDAYSPYSGDAMVSSGDKLYLRMDSVLCQRNYSFRAYFYDNDGNGVWVDMEYLGEAQMAGLPQKPGMNSGEFPGEPWGGRGGMRGEMPGAASYGYYVVNKPAGYGSVRIYAYDSGEAQNEAYIAASDSEATIPSGRDTFAVQQIENGIILCAGWTNFQTASGNTGLQYSCKGIKAANTVTVAGGNINIISRDDGIHANSDEILESTGEKGLGNVTILAGVLTIQSDDDGIHADQDLYIRGGTLNVGNAYEGLEANRLYPSDGSVFVAATDDALNANNKGAYAGYIEISGGYLEAETHNGDTDTLDANGTIRIIGGAVILKNGQMSGIGRNGGNFDADRGVSIEGGTVIAVGCVGEQLNGAVINMNQMWERGAYVIRDSKGNEIAAFSLGNAYQAYQFWSDRFVSGETYTVYRDSEQVFGFQK